MKHPFQIVPATVDDLPTIERIARATWPDTFGDIISAEQIEYMLKMMYRQEALEKQLTAGHHFLLLRDGAAKNEAVGYLSYQLDYEPGMAKIHKIYVLPSTQGKGFGKALIQRAEAIVRKAGQQRLRLDVNHQNKAISFYEYLGFAKKSRFNTDIGNNYLMEDWQMEKQLQ